MIFFPVQGNNVRHLERYKRQLSSEELLNLSPEELCKDRLSEEYFRLTTEGDCRDVVRYVQLNILKYVVLQSKDFTLDNLQL